MPGCILENGNKKDNLVHQIPLISAASKSYSHLLPVIQNYSPCSIFVPPVPFVDPIEVLMCSSNGREFIIEAHDITLRIPEGAIPEGLTLAIEVGVTLHGPFCFPTNMRPTSPILWLCPQQDIPLQKPVEVILPHFLNVSREQFGLCFLKADHNDCDTKKYNFHQLTHQPAKFCQREASNYGHLYTRHFCFLCIGAENTREVALGTGYCLSYVSPEPQPTTPSPFSIYFCVTYYLKTCLRTLHQQFPSGFYISKTRFSFKNPEDGSQPRIKISLERPQGWLMAQRSINPQITAKDVDCWDKDAEELKLMEEEKMYPPRFEIRITPNHGAGSCLSYGKVIFSGATDELYTDVPAPLPDSPCPSPGIISNGNFHPQGYYNEDEYVGFHYAPSEQILMEKVAANIPAKWRDVGIGLGLTTANLDRIEAECRGSNAALRCFERVFYEWKCGKTHGRYQWSTLLKVLKSPLVREFSLADTLIRELQ